MRTLGTLFVVIGLGCWACAAMFLIFAVQAGKTANPYGLLWILFGSLGVVPIVIGCLLRIAFRKTHRPEPSLTS